MMRVTFLVLLLFLAAPPAAAAPFERVVLKERPSRAAPAHFARILKQSFERVKPSEGVWTGVVEGNGRVFLRLLLLRRGVIASSWLMGSVKLANKATTFYFKTYVPPDGDWSWRIETGARPVES